MDKCSLCRQCETVCPAHCHVFSDQSHTVSFEKCILCGDCVRRCHNNALKIYGSAVSPESILDIVEKDRIYYQNSGGGVTISGGEPLLQWEFTRDLLRLCKGSGLHTCLDTSGFASQNVLMEVMEYVDVFLYDYKATGREKHIALTGVPNDVILNNLELIEHNQRTVILRCPMIPGINDDEVHLKTIGNIAKTHSCIDHVEVMAYHDLGVFKAENIGVGQHIIQSEKPAEELKQHWLSVIKDTGYSSVIIG